VPEHDGELLLTFVVVLFSLFTLQFLLFMALILPVENKAPQWGSNCFIAPNCTIVGDVVMGDECSVWFNAVVRGDVNSIRMGQKVNVQDGAVIHCTFKRSKTIIGDFVSIGHNAIVQCWLFPVVFNG
jgi:carbonic anhydrase/acetyltransferase-like protein (isoleucine patch superfamily)